MARRFDWSEESTDQPVFSLVSVLAEFAVSVLAVTTSEDLFDAMVDVASAALDADSVHVGRIDRPHGRLRILRNAGRLAECEEIAPADESYLIADYPQLLYTSETALPWRGNVDDHDTAQNDRIVLASQGKAHALSVPVISPDGVWGELLVTRFRSRPFSAGDEEVALVIAGMAAAGLARVFGDERLRELAYTDALTGLANRRAADEQLEKWANVPAAAVSLTVMLCDVNGLKKVNDTHGHLIGDQLIRDIAVHVSAAAGRLPSGLAARIGGDEFLIASPSPDRTMAAAVIDELTTAASTLTFGEGVSCGIAAASALLRPESSAQSLVRSLLRIADSEQYRHKVANRQAHAAVADAADNHPTGRMHRDADHDLDALAATAADSGSPTEPAPTTASRFETMAAWELIASFAKDTDVGERLARAAHVVCAQADGVAWWVSQADRSRETVWAVTCGLVRKTGETDGLWPRVELDPNVYRLADFPATAHVVRSGGVFYVDNLIGDAAEGTAPSSVDT